MRWLCWKSESGGIEMTKQEVIKRFCQLSDTVSSVVFQDEKSADCFCGDLFEDTFSFEDDVLNFIERAVEAECKKVEIARKNNKMKNIVI